MKTKNAETPRRQPRGGDNLDARYGAIGISAVAAAVRYQGSDDRKAEPAEPKPDKGRKPNLAA